MPYISTTFSWIAGSSGRGATILLALLLICRGSSFAAQPGLNGAVHDADGAPIAGAKVDLVNRSGFVLSSTASTASGEFFFEGVYTPGEIAVYVRAPGFAPVRRILSDGEGIERPIGIDLSLAPLPQSVTVTADRGQLEDSTETAAVVSIVDLQSGTQAPLPTIGNALENQPGILLQQSTYGQVSPFLRGLTGYQVLNLVDGIRFNNSTFRSGPNQYLAFLEPSQAESIEAMLGPSSTQYGSDSLGGAINVLTRRPSFATGFGIEFHGDISALGATADASGFLNGQASVSDTRQSFLIGGTGRKLNDLRAGGGADSRNVYRRFFGLDDGQIRSLLGNRQQDSGFQQTGLHTRYALRINEDQDFSAWYQRGTMENVRGYKDLLGGRGRLISEFGPQDLDFLYARYEKRRLGFLDSATGTFSFNRQLDGTRVQTLRATNTITDDESAVGVFGYSGQATTHAGSRHSIVFGGEVYAENIDASRSLINPVTGTETVARALYPNGSDYRTTGFFVQDRVELIRSRLSVQAGIRYTSVSASTYADRNIDPGGENLGVADSNEDFHDVTWNANVTWRALQSLSVFFLTGRGFRAPNMNDLGALGLNDLGYEIPVSQAVDAGALLGNSASDGAISLGRNAETLQAESLQNYELGLKVGSGRWTARVQGYLSDLNDPIVRRTLLFPANSVPTSLAGIPVSANAPTAAQATQGAVTVSTPFDSQSVKAFVNDGASRYYGLDSLISAQLNSRWRVDANYSYIRGRDLNPNRNIRRLPPQHGRIALLYVPTGRHPWIRIAGRFAGEQDRLSGGDIDDERIGASRRRSDIGDFFNGTRNATLVAAGADGVSGTADDVFEPTGETLLQIQDRALPIGATINGVSITSNGTRVPLFLSTAGWFALDIQGGVPLAERLHLTFGVQNLFDQNYRQHGSGVDMPGINGYTGITYRW